MKRDVDQIIERLKAEIPGVCIEQLKVLHPSDDGGLWFIRVPDRTGETQIEPSVGACPFIIESDFGPDRFEGHTIDEVVRIVKGLYV
jgi:hypothetical protein